MDSKGFHDAITKCKRILYAGFTSTQTSGIEWLNDVCLHLTSICQHLQKLSNTTWDEIAVDTSMLCANQLFVCLVQLEHTLNVERIQANVMPAARQHFLDRMLQCLERLQSIAVDSSAMTVTKIDANFVNYLDIALELVAPLAIFNTNNVDCSNVAARNADIMLESVNIRSVVDSLIGQALAFANVALTDDYKPLTAVCQKVLKECIDFQQDCSLDRSVCTGDEQSLRLKAAGLENALYQLDSLVNECLLRLIFDVFIRLDDEPLRILQQLVSDSGDNHLIDAHVNSFDELSDKLQQIGVFAAALATNPRVKSTIHSCLASAESLESYLIPSILSRSNSEALVLEAHWMIEMRHMQECIHNIIDTEAFCASVIDNLRTTNDDLAQQWNDNVANKVLDKCLVLCAHFFCNRNDLHLDLMDTKRRICYDAFRMMINECRAAVEQQLSDRKRIFKRFRVLLSVLKKFKSTLRDSGAVSVGNEHDPSENAFEFGNVSPPASGLCEAFERIALSPSMVAVKDDSMSNAEEFLKAHGIEATSSSILYTSKPTESGDLTRHQRSKCSTTLVSPQIVTLKRAVQKRSSLRVALFKRATQDMLTESTTCAGSERLNDETLDLQITDILEQITDLSSTLQTLSTS